MICPGSAQTFMQQFEKQMEHHRDMDLADRKQYWIGTFISGFLLLVVMGVLGMAIAFRMQWVALSISLVPVIAVAAYWRRTRTSSSMSFTTATAHAQLQATTDNQKFPTKQKP